MKYIMASIAVLALVVLGFLFVNQYNLRTRSAIPTTTSTPINSPTTTQPPEDLPVKISHPQAGQIIDSPLEISGQAKGTWFFEATFPVRVLDAEGKVVGSGYVEAQDDWMTENYVPFKGTIEFTTPANGAGSLVLAKDNPSGLPENDQEFTIPIRFNE